MVNEEIKKYKNVVVFDHPVITHKISLLRDINTPCNEFRQIVKEISTLELYEALKNFPTIKEEIKTPIENTIVNKIKFRDICFVPILRAGLGMADGAMELAPTATCGHIGMYRDEITLKPHEYMCKLPSFIGKKKVFLLDPMLATGGSAIDACRQLIEHGAKDITFICIIAAPEGVKAFHEACPDIPLYIGALDRQLNENGYICPGLGDCGDRIFNTVECK